MDLGPKLKELGYGIPPSCIGVLADLWQEDGINQKDLGLSVIKTKSSINKILEALEKHELIIKKEDPSDKRNKLIFLTKDGKNLRLKIEAQAITATKDLLPDISLNDIKTTKIVLKALYLQLCEKHSIIIK